MNKKMFKKKQIAKFPETPKPPSWENMNEDISKANTNDILFSLRIEHEKNLIYDEIHINNQKENFSDEDVIQLAIKYKRVNEKLEEDLEQLKVLSHALDERCSNLKEAIENVKQQAMTAISN
ncbi:UNVERIFIED_CONTAM: hypothetical protein RMT77_012019 [Armadillidium vulgare]